MRLILLILSGILARQLNAADFCAVRVIVSTELGLPASAPVTLIVPSNRVIRKVEAVNGQAEFCDFGFGDHTIRVGGDQCGYVTTPPNPTSLRALTAI